MFATSVLSMRVHMPHITRIIHIAPPASLEEYIQEVGRAGRSGLQSYAYLHYRNSDISGHRSKNSYIAKPLTEYCGSNTCLREHLLQHFGFKITIKRSNCCSFCQAELQEDEMLRIVILNKNVRAIDRGNLEFLTAKFNDLLAEKDTSASLSSMSGVILSETETIESFSDKLMLLTENISSAKDQNVIISYGITNSRDSKRVFQLIEKYSVLK